MSSIVAWIKWFHCEL